MCHMSHVTCHVSHVMGHMYYLPFTSFFHLICVENTTEQMEQFSLVVSGGIEEIVSRITWFRRKIKGDLKPVAEYLLFPECHPQQDSRVLSAPTSQITAGDVWHTEDRRKSFDWMLFFRESEQYGLGLWWLVTLFVVIFENTLNIFFLQLYVNICAFF